MNAVFNQRRVRRVEATAGVCCFVLGLVTPVLGGLLTVIEWMLGSPVHRWLHVAATAFFIAGIPLILFAGFCLDWSETERKGVTHQEQHSREAALGLKKHWQQNSSV